MRSAAIAGLAFAAGVLSAACAWAGPDDPADVQQPFETLLAETHSGIGDRRREVVHDEAGFMRLWGEVHSGVAPTPAAPAVDFARHMLVVVASGTRPSGGFGIKVQAVALLGERLEVAVLETCPAPGAMVTTELTQPVEVVRVPKLSQPVTFRETRAASCR